MHLPTVYQFLQNSITLIPFTQIPTLHEFIIHNNGINNKHTKLKTVDMLVVHVTLEGL